MTAPVPQAAACPSRLCLDADDGTGHQVITLGCARADAHRLHYDEDRGLWWAVSDRIAELGQLARDVLAAYLEVIGTDRPADIAAEIAQWEATLKGTP